MVKILSVAIGLLLVAHGLLDAGEEATKRQGQLDLKIIGVRYDGPSRAFRLTLAGPRPNNPGTQYEFFGEGWLVEYPGTQYQFFGEG